jgi:hypothetical protein
MADEKFKKIDKEFCITDGTLNVYKYRLLTAGLMLNEVKKNPIGFLMHNRDEGVAVRWEEFRVDGDKVYAKPTVNLSHPKGADIVSQIENGFLNAASVGKIVCLAATDDPSLKIKGQTGPTVTEWFPREISLVDIPGNYNAVANLYDLEDNELDLADFVKLKNPDMSKVMLTAAMLTAMNLSDNSTSEDASKAFQDLVDNAAKVPGLEKDLADKTDELGKKEKELKDLQDSTVVKEVQDLLDAGVNAGKLTVETSAKLKETYGKNPKGLKDLIDVMPAQTKVTGDDKDKDLSDLKDVEGKSWDELYNNGKLEAIKQKMPDLYAKLKKQKYPDLKED